MRIGGLQKFSFCDYPGKLSAVIFTQGCNFKCPFCHNGSLLGSAGDSTCIETDSVLTFLESRKGKLDGVVITGGEPTIHRDLDKLIKDIRNLGFAVKLDTNGSNPDRVRSLITDGLIDFVAMDVKAPVSKYDILTGTRAPVESILQSIRLISESGLDHEFRTTFVKPLLSDMDIEELCKLIPNGSVHRIQEFNPTHCLNPALCSATSAGKSSERFAAL